jgi:hypothetical protein
MAIFNGYVKLSCGITTTGWALLVDIWDLNSYQVTEDFHVQVVTHSGNPEKMAI